MPLTFAQADALFRQDKLNELVADAEGRRFLKLRSLNRTEYLERLFQVGGRRQARTLAHVNVRCRVQCRHQHRND